VDDIVDVVDSGGEQARGIPAVAGDLVAVGRAQQPDVVVCEIEHGARRQARQTRRARSTRPVMVAVPYRRRRRTAELLTVGVAPRRLLDGRCSGRSGAAVLRRGPF
jgi:hypothetical protein